MNRDVKILALLDGGRYFVSEDGTIFDRESGNYRPPTQDADGHQVVNLQECGVVRVSRLVALRHHGMPPGDRYQVRHLNGRITDDRSVNLSWASPKEISAAAHAAGKIPHPVGKKLPHTKLTPEQVGEIRRMLNEGVAMRELARRFGVTKGAVSGIKYGKSWRHV